METEIINNEKMNQILTKLSELQKEIESLKQKNKGPITAVDEVLSEIWDNEEDERWNDY